MRWWRRSCAALILAGSTAALGGCGHPQPAAQPTQAQPAARESAGSTPSASLSTSGTGAASSPQTPSFTQSVTFHSEALNKEMRMTLYLPPDYNEETDYPVLYLLHGYTDDERSWIPRLGVDQAADRLIQEGKIRPLIIVVPQLDNSFGINSGDTWRMESPGDPENSWFRGRYEDYLTRDLVGFIDQNYSTIQDAVGRFIGGNSMGGFAALHAAFRHPDLYSRAGGHSPALIQDSWSFLYPTEAARRETDPLLLARTRDLRGLRVYLDCGDEDHFKFYEPARKLGTLLQDAGVDAEYHENPGAHDYAYWSSQVDRYLEFYAGP